MYKIDVYAGQDALGGNGARGSRKSYSYAHITDVEGKHVVTTTLSLRARESSAYHPATERAMCLLSSLERIEPQNGRSMQIWMRETGCVVNVREYMDDRDVELQYFELTGERHGHLLAVRDTVTAPPITPEEKLRRKQAFETLFADYLPDNTSSAID